ncbi:MAG: hypothetical protein LBM93_07950 [Oscillospiraceae bacterium]|nr:hypothetical protein [Oscillospiraceae bacterium]
MSIKEKREWFEIAVKLIKNKEFYEPVYDIFMKMCVSAGKNFSVYEEREYVAKDVKDIIPFTGIFTGVYVPNDCYFDIFTELCKRVLNRQAFDDFKLSGFYQIPLHPMGIYSAVYSFIQVFLFANYWEFLSDKPTIKRMPLSSKDTRIFEELSKKAMHNFAIEYPCRDFFNDWEVKSARYVLSGKHRKEIGLNG